MEILKVITMFGLGIGGIIKGVIDIRKNTNRTLQVILSCLVMGIGIIGYVLLKKWLFLIIVLIGFVLIFILG